MIPRAGVAQDPSMNDGCVLAFLLTTLIVSVIGFVIAIYLLTYATLRICTE